MSLFASRSMRLVAAGMVVVVFACGDNAANPLPQAVALHIRPVAADGPFAVNVGTSIALEALPVAADSAVVAGAVVASWQSSDTTVATITSQGTLQAHCVGSTTVVATTAIAGRSVSGTRSVLVASTGPACAPR